MNASRDLPNGWIFSNLGEVAIAQSGAGFPKTFQGHTSGDYPLAKVSDITEAVKFNGGVIAKANNYLSRDEAKKLGARVFPEGTTLFAKIGEALRLNRRALSALPILADNNVMGLIPDRDQVLSKYLYYFMQTVDLSDYSQATTVPSVRKSDIENIGLPLPPLPEQKWIVAKIEELFTQLEAGTSALERVRAGLRRYRASVLNAAIAGTFTQNWRTSGERLGDIATVIEQINASSTVRRDVPERVDFPTILSNFIVAEGWALLSVAELLRKGLVLDVKDGNHGGVHPKREDFSEEGLPFITANLVNDFHVDYEAAPRLKGKPLAKLNVGFSYPGDVILTHKGSVGRVGLCTQKCVLTPQTTYYRGNPAFLYDRFLAYLFGSDFFQSQLSAVKSQTTRDFVSLSKQYHLFLLIPPLEEQRRIVAEVERRLSVARQVESSVEEALVRAGRLRQSILKHAFDGKLS
jgi:type I restriction enzyme, S subunit